MEIEVNVLCPKCKDDDCMAHAVAHSYSEIEIGEIIPCETCGYILDENEIIGPCQQLLMDRITRDNNREED